MAAVHTQAHPPSPSLLSVDAPPSFTTTDNHHPAAIELRNLSSSSVDSTDPPPTYADASGNNVAGSSSAPTAFGGFHPTLQLQVETKGKPVLSLPVPLRPDPVPVFAVAADGTVEPQPRYVSVRPSRKSGSCTLYAGDGIGADGVGQGQAARRLSTTLYRFGHGRPPRVMLFDPLAPAAAAVDVLQRDFDDGEQRDHHQLSDRESRGEHHHGDDNAEVVDADAWDAFEIECRGLFTRAQVFRTRLGTFEWRYATRAERKAIGANQLLVLDRIVRIAHAQNQGAAAAAATTTAGGKVKNGAEEVRTPVAQLVRNEELRTAGSSAGSAGNGGRLLMDLGEWRDAKVEREAIEVLVVTTCISMLKKEVDRRRAQQMGIMAAVAGGAHG